MNPSFRHAVSESAIRAAIYPMVRGLWRTRMDPESVDLGPDPCFLYGNHSNNLDPFLVNWFEPFGHISSGVLTAEYMKGGIVTAALTGIGLLSTRKRVPEPHLIGQILRLLDSGRKVMIYPEGGRRWDGRPAAWIPATAKLFARVGVPVHPVQTFGSYVAWPRWARFPRPGRPRIRILPPVALERRMPVEEAIARLAPPIDIDENEPPPDVRPTRAFRPADGIRRLLYRHPETGRFDSLYTPDGERVLDREQTLRWRMLPDSLLLDESNGEIHRTDALYQAIRRMPLETVGGGPIVTNRVELSLGESETSLLPVGSVQAALFPDRIELDGSRVVPMESVLHTGIERNSKLQLWTRSGLVQLAFTGRGSALGWEDSIVRLANLLPED